MRLRFPAALLFALGLLLSGAASATEEAGVLIDRAIAGDHRSPVDRARDVHRHPRETLLFMGLRPDMTVVEIWPAAGWFSDILAPVLHERGRLLLARHPVSLPKTPEVVRKRDQAFLARMATRPDVYGKVVTSEIQAPGLVDVAPPGTVDLVLTFRNVHNWAKSGTAEAMFRAFFQMLKPGGVLGVEEHRARPGTSLDDQIASGYMDVDTVVAWATAAGFRFDASSEVNANRRDTKDHPMGVWTLPPTLRLGDQDREKYLAIGESDRMTLRFVRP